MRKKDTSISHSDTRSTVDLQPQASIVLSDLQIQSQWHIQLHSEELYNDIND